MTKNEKNRKPKDSYLFIDRSTKQHVKNEHKAKAEKQRIGGAALASVRVGFWDHFIGDDV